MQDKNHFLKDRFFDCAFRWGATAMASTTLQDTTQKFVVEQESASCLHDDERHLFVMMQCDACQKCLSWMCWNVLIRDSHHLLLALQINLKMQPGRQMLID